MCLGLTIHPATADNLAAIYVMLRPPNILLVLFHRRLLEESDDSTKQAKLLKQSSSVCLSLKRMLMVIFLDVHERTKRGERTLPG